MITRRRIVLALGANTIAPLASFAQQPQKSYRVGVLAFSSPASVGLMIEAFTSGLAELGYVEGKNILFERRFAAGDLGRLTTLAVELVQQKVDVIYASGTPATAAAKQATGTIPIVFANVADPVWSGFVASLARPGSNITGTSLMSFEVSAKRLEILKEAFPKISRIAVFVSSEPQVAGQFADVERAAKALKIEVLRTQFGSRDNFREELALLRKWRADAIYVVESSTNLFNRSLLAKFAAEIRLPGMFGTKAYTEGGGLMSYGASYEANYRRAATYVDKILKGAKPADIPVEQPTQFELVLNMTAAKALGIRFPNSILVQATKVIE
jgi:putative ABC transport system substrate-binding protein